MTRRLEYLWTIEQAIQSRSLNVGVVGLGYVGLPVAVAFARAGFQVIGVDVDVARIAAIASGRSPIGGDEPELEAELNLVVSEQQFRATEDILEIRDASVVTINVQTPLTDDHHPDLIALRTAAEQVGAVIRSGSLVIVESTVPPGTTMGTVAPILESQSGLTLGQDLFVGACPERVMPGLLLKNIRTVARVAGGSDADVARVMVQLYATIVDADVDATDPTTAEMAKVVENTYRDVQIAFANEIALACADLDLDVWRIRELVNKVPFRDMHQPGGGVGGHCIPKDPWLLAAATTRDLPLLTAARAVNDAMPKQVARRALEILETLGTSRNRVAILGVAYLPGSDDARNSPALVLAELLEEVGIQPELHDPHVRRFQRSLQGVLASVDLAVVMTPHPEYEHLHSPVPVVDARRLGSDDTLVRGP
jgi:UDP-N-acetyl-D-mannosaminuronic acid dehydrogenase